MPDASLVLRPTKFKANTLRYRTAIAVENNQSTAVLRQFDCGSATVFPRFDLSLTSVQPKARNSRCTFS